MRIKTYHTDTVESAVRQARLELGEDAMLIDSRKLPPGRQAQGAYEVRFAAAGRAESEGRPAPAADLAELSKGLEDLRRVLHAFTYNYYLPLAGMGSRPELADLYRELTGAEVDAELAAELVSGLIPAAAAGAARPDLEAELAARIRERLEVCAEIGLPGRRPRVAALVGPPGAGKTTTLIKLAVQYGLQKRLATCLVTTDNYRVASADQLLAFGSILEVEVRRAEEVGRLQETLRGFERGGPDLVLIDTPGHGFRELEQYGAELANFLRSRDDIDVHLVLSASTKPRDLTRLVERYRDFGPRKLLFTKLDETLTAGPVLNEAGRTRLPLSFLATGQRIPEDLQPASREAVADLILHRRTTAAAR